MHAIFLILEEQPGRSPAGVTLSTTAVAAENSTQAVQRWLATLDRIGRDPRDCPPAAYVTTDRIIAFAAEHGSDPGVFLPGTGPRSMSLDLYDCWRQTMLTGGKEAPAPFREVTRDEIRVALAFRAQQLRQAA